MYRHILKLHYQWTAKGRAFFDAERSLTVPCRQWFVWTKRRFNRGDVGILHSASPSVSFLLRISAMTDSMLSTINLCAFMSYITAVYSPRALFLIAVVMPISLPAAVGTLVVLPSGLVCTQSISMLISQSVMFLLFALFLNLSFFQAPRFWVYICILTYIAQKINIFP